MSRLKFKAWMHYSVVSSDKKPPPEVPPRSYAVRFIIWIKDIGVFTRSKVMGVLIFDDIVPGGRFLVRIGH